jgi:biopolymer transport protein TolQ
MSLVASANPLSYLFTGDYPWILTFGVLLLLISLFAWSVIVSKAMALKRSQKTDAVFLQRFRDSEHPLQIFAKNAKSQGSILHSVYTLGAKELAYHWLGSSEVDDTFEPRLRRADPMSKRETALYRTRLSRIASEASMRIESKMKILSSVVNGVPMLGLLATAWGLMAGFGAATSSDFTAMQPGIGTSLSMTVLALLVAVPAGIGARILNGLLRSKSVEIRQFCDEFDASISSSYQNVIAREEAAESATESAPSIAAVAPAVAAAALSVPPASSARLGDLDDLPEPELEPVAPAPAAVPSPNHVTAFEPEPVVASLQGSDTPVEVSSPIVGQQLSFEDEHEVAEFDDEPIINPVARQTAMQAPELLFEPQV